MTGKLLFKQAPLPPEVERALNEFLRDYKGAIDPIRRDLLDDIQEGVIDTSSTSSVRVGVERVVGNYTSDVRLVHEAGVVAGAEAGRSAAARTFQLDVAFDVVPESTLRELNAFAKEANGHALSTLSDETTAFIRTAHEEGQSIPDIAAAINEDLFNGQLQGWQAERTARTATIPSSNAGHHSAYQEATDVIAEEWISALDDRTRATHEEANGQIVAIDNTFKVGGHHARYPGDPRLPQDELVQCRCRDGAVFRDELSESELATLESGGRIYR